VELTAVNAQDAGEIERAVTEFARAPNSGLIVTGAQIVSHRELIAALVAGHRLPQFFPANHGRWRRPDLSDQRLVCCLTRDAP
jgi:hypothetical protein